MPPKDLKRSTTGKSSDNKHRKTNKSEFSESDISEDDSEQEVEYFMPSSDEDHDQQAAVTLLAFREKATNEHNYLIQSFLTCNAPETRLFIVNLFARQEPAVQTAILENIKKMTRTLLVDEMETRFKEVQWCKTYTIISGHWQDGSPLIKHEHQPRLKALEAPIRTNLFHVPPSSSQHAGSSQKELLPTPEILNHTLLKDIKTPEFLSYFDFTETTQRDGTSYTTGKPPYTDWLIQSIADEEHHVFSPIKTVQVAPEKTIRPGRILRRNNDEHGRYLFLTNESDPNAKTMDMYRFVAVIRKSEVLLQPGIDTLIPQEASKVPSSLQHASTQPPKQNLLTAYP